MKEFLFKDLVLLTDRDLIRLLRKTGNATLLLAAYGDTSLIVRIGSVLSEYGRECFYEDMGNMGAVVDTDQAAARKEIEVIFNELYQSGELLDWTHQYAS